MYENFCFRHGPWCPTWQSVSIKFLKKSMGHHWISPSMHGEMDRCERNVFREASLGVHRRAATHPAAAPHRRDSRPGRVPVRSAASSVDVRGVGRPRAAAAADRKRARDQHGTRVVARDAAAFHVAVRRRAAGRAVEALQAAREHTRGAHGGGRRLRRWQLRGCLTVVNLARIEIAKVTDCLLYTSPSPRD